MQRPNILVFMTDQQRGDSLETARMPHVDQLRREGVTFTNSYTVAPHCCPSRATFFSGLYPSQHGVWNNVKFGNALSRGFYEGVRLFSEDLKESGYRMYFSGKWHASVMEGPLDRGFDVMDEPVPRPGTRCKYVIGDLKKTQYRHTRPDTWEWGLYDGLDPQRGRPRGEAEIRREGYPPFVLYGEQDNPFQDEDVVADAVRGLLNMERSEQPWFYFVGTLGPHDPYYLPKKYLDMYPLEDIRLPENFSDKMRDKPGLYRRIRDRFDQLSPEEHRQALRHYLAFCSYEDDLFGQVLDALEARGERENTVVIFMSDHGDYAGEHGLWCKGLPCFRGAYHIPTVVRWPAGIRDPGRCVDCFLTLADFAPTFRQLAGVTAEREGPGRSFVPFLRGEAVEGWRNELYTQSNGNELYGIQRSVMTPEWKFVYNGYDYDELYHLTEDPGETVNLVDRPEFQPVVKELSRRLWRFAKENGDVCINPYIFCGLAKYGPGIIHEGPEA